MKQFILAILVCAGMCIGVVGCGSEAVEETSSSSVRHRYQTVT